MVQSYSFSWLTSADSISKYDWEMCFDDDPRASYELAKAVEKANLENISFHYLKITKGNDLIGLVPCYLQQTPLDIISSQRIYSLCSHIRKYFSSFLVVRALIAGSPLAICRDLFGFAKISETEIGDVFKGIAFELESKGRELRAHAVALKEIETKDFSRVKKVVGSNFKFVSSQPCAYIKLASEDNKDYVGRLRNHYRSVYKHRVKSFANGQAHWKQIASCFESVDDVYALFLQVQEKQPSFQFLTKDFFKELLSDLNESMYINLAYQGGDIVAFSIMLKGQTCCFPLYLGFDYERRNELSLYYNVLYQAIRDAESFGYSELLLGQTAHESKALIGAEFRELYLAISPLSWVVAIIVRYFDSLFFPKEIPKSKNVFR